MADIPDPFLVDDDDAPLSTRLTSPIPAKRPISPAQPRLIRGLRAPSLFLPIPSVRLAPKPAARERHVVEPLNISIVG